MAGFGSTDLTDINALKSAVGVITSGLSEAFNTTLLGLLLSMLLIFPMSATQKREEDCLTDIDAFCNENLLSRLNDGGAGAAAASTTATTAAAGPVEGLGEMFREIAMIQKQFVSDLEKVARSVEELTTVVKYAAQQIDERSKAHQQQVEKKLGESLDALTAKANETVAANGKSVEKYVSRIAVGIESLNNALATLGEKRIVLQRPQSRGWFFNRKS
jgi:biopolymer transport protein ExbB/TolQ